MADRSGRLRGLTRKKSSVTGIRSKVGHLAATPFKFDYIVTFSEVRNIKDAAKQVVVVWERRDKVLSTTLSRVTNNRAIVRESLNMEVTLYKGTPQPGAPDTQNAGYHQKMAKFAVRIDSEAGKTVGKIHVNLADFARVPSGTVSQEFALSNGSVLVCKIDTRLSASGRGRRGGANSTAGSDRSAMTTGSGGLASYDDDDGSMDSLDDLMNEIENDPDGPDEQEAEKRTALARNATSQPSSPVGSTKKNRVAELRAEIETLEERTRKLQDAIRSSEQEAGRLRDEHEEVDRQLKALGRVDSVGSDSGDRAEKLTQKIEQIERSNEEMEVKNEDLEKDLEVHVRTIEKLGRYSSTISSNDAEGTALKEELDELQRQVGREPDLTQVAKELQETKALLSLATMERDEIFDSLRQLYAKAKRSPAPGSVLA